MLTRLGESGADAFTIMRIAGHSSVTVSQRYVHPSPESLERAFERLDTMNTSLRGVARATAKAAVGAVGVATKSATVQKRKVQKNSSKLLSLNKMGA